MPTNKVVARQVVEEIWNKGDLSAISVLYVPETLFHDPSLPELKTPQDFEQLVVSFRQAFPDLEMKVEEQIAERDLVLTWWGAKGTQQAPLMGIAPTNKQVRVTGFTLDLFKNGKIVESRSQWDALGMYQQLGVAPTFHLLVPMMSRH